MRISHEQGLTHAEAIRRLEQYGPNVLEEKKPRSGLHIFAQQFQSPLIWVLLVAAAITLLVSDILDAVVILVAVLVNTILGFFQEYKAEHTLYTLKKMLSPQAQVVREGAVQTIAATQLVPGDLVNLAAGDRVPADGEVMEAVDLFINEAILTGESVPVEKNQTAAMRSCVMGTTVISGRALMRVTQTGMRTSLGSLAQGLNKTEEESTPLQQQLSTLANQLAVVVLVSCVVLFGIGIVFGETLTSMLTTAVAIAVSAIPEGMVVSLTVILALGMQRIMKRHAIVRRLVAAETLGSVSVICVDKTGTITQGTMSVVSESLIDSSRAIQAAVLANNLADPLEIALWEWARGKDHVDPQQLVDASARLGEIPFDAVRKYMAVATKTGLWVKGAPEVIIEKSTLSPQERKKWLVKVEESAAQGLRMLAFGVGKRAAKLPHKIEAIEFLGFVGIADPVRPEVIHAVARVKAAGIAVKVITGDYRHTAEAILKQIGIPITSAATQIMEGRELERISDDQLQKRVGDIELFYRVSPQQKHRIVTALQERGAVVAMTGDGVNDAMAIKKADIGIVVVGASDVARDTADVVLLDSNFQTIAAAVEEGRGMFENIRKVVLYLLSDVFVEMFLILGSILLRLPLPLTPLQILWINLIDDGLPALALTMDAPDKELMRHLPRKKSEPIVNGHMRFLIGLVSLVAVGLMFGVYVWLLGTGASLSYARTLVFAMVGVSSLIYVFSCRSLTRPRVYVGIGNIWLLSATAIGVLLQIMAIYHPWGRRVFETIPLGLNDWILVAGVGGVLIVVIEGAKYAYMRKRRHQVKPL